MQVVVYGRGQGQLLVGGRLRGHPRGLLGPERPGGRLARMPGRPPRDWWKVGEDSLGCCGLQGGRMECWEVYLVLPKA